MMGLQRIKLILDIDDDSADELLTLILKKCEMWVRNMCGIFDVDERLELVPLTEPLASVVEELSVIRYNKLGSEGLTTESVGPLAMDYNDVPPELAAIINKFKRVRF